MTSDRTVPPGDLLTDVLTVLADVLRVRPERIDPEQTFQSLGFDSLLTVEFVAVLNARYGLRILPTELYDHPSPAAFARRLAREEGLSEGAGAIPGAGSVPGAGPVPGAGAASVPVSATVRAGGPYASDVHPVPYASDVHTVPYASDTHPVPYGGSRPESGSRAPADGGAILDVLREQLAAILGCDAWEIDPSASFPLLGVDSIIGTELVTVLNRTFGLRERAAALHDHPNLAALAAHVAVRTGAAPAPAPAAPAAGTAAHGTELDVLLDAVRDDRLTVDEALVLLGRHG
ncbi:phosphopantetheine-binding protein [Streptomyces sp. bgisy126]|uniref:acyl carrier protein n=1 Tax=unclassified Streptomyces TaxID=2593676 RepID=UPI003EBFCE56